MDKFVERSSSGHNKKQKKDKPKITKHKPTYQHQQMFLDLGQKLFGKNNECKSCGMIYVIGDIDDERRHDQNCAKARDGPILSSMKNHRIVCDNIENKSGKTAVILEVNLQGNTCTKSVQNVLTIVQNELGSSSDYVSTDKEIVYLYVIEGTKIVIGCLVAEEVFPKDLLQLSSSITATDVTIKTSTLDEDEREAEFSTIVDNKENIINQSRHSDKVKQFSSSSSASSSFMGKRNRENNDIISTIHPQIERRSEGTTGEEIEGVKSLAVIENCSEISRPMNGTLGVKQIWVHSKHRRSNVARRLVDTARKCFSFGSIVMKSHVAFSQPTSDGLKFALAYSGQNTIWAYA